MARASLPLTLVFILSACGGSAKEKQIPTRTVHGPGFTFTAPAAWSTSRTPSTAAARSGDSRVSASVFNLVKPYDPARFEAVAKELDGVAEKLAKKVDGKIVERETTVVDGRRIRAYRYVSNGTHMRIGFFLDGRREYQLLCTAPGSDDTDGACDLLFSSFSVA